VGGGVFCLTPKTEDCTYSALTTAPSQTPVSSFALAVACKDGCIVAADACTYMGNRHRAMVHSRPRGEGGQEGGAFARPHFVRTLKSGGIVAGSGAVVDFDTILDEFLRARCSGAQSPRPFEVFEDAPGNGSHAGIEVFAAELEVPVAGLHTLAQQKIYPAPDSGAASPSRAPGIEALLHYASVALHHIERYAKEKQPLSVSLVGAGLRTSWKGEGRFVAGRVNHRGALIASGERIVASGKGAEEMLAYLRPRVLADTSVAEAREHIIRCLGSRSIRFGTPGGDQLCLYLGLLRGARGAVGPGEESSDEARPVLVADGDIVLEEELITNDSSHVAVGKFA